jgi:hypothetical protein
MLVHLPAGLVHAATTACTTDLTLLLVVLICMYVVCIIINEMQLTIHIYFSWLSWHEMGFFLLLSLYLVIKVGYPIQSNDLVDFFHLSDILVCLLLIYMWLRELHLDVVAYLLVHVEYLLTFLM